MGDGRDNLTPFRPGQTGNPTGRNQYTARGGRSSSSRSPVLRAMRRVMAGRAATSDLDEKAKKWYDDDFPGFVKEFNRLLAIEEGKAEAVPAPAQGGAQVVGVDENEGKILELIDELRGGPKVVVGEEMPA